MDILTRDDTRHGELYVRLTDAEAEIDARVAAERERCAKLCDVIEDGRLPDGSPVAGMAGECAWAIREGIAA
jgi:hypothetical protein